MSRRPKGALRRGWTTGACATAATKAAYHRLLTGRFPDPVSITLPRGEEVGFALARESAGADWAEAGIVKDAGDDPDVTHGALITAAVRRAAAGVGVVFRAGEGVGTVTLPGLPLAPGEPAINPVPRQMMAGVVAKLAAAHGDGGDVEITVSIPGGEALAAKTMNGRLGIVGGLSILGTTGIVIPYSCASWIASIRQGIEVARAAGENHLAAATGRGSERAVRRLYGLDEVALIDMGDFAGGVLKHLRDRPVARLTLAGGFAKIGKLAQGHLDLHSGASRVDFDYLAARLERLGAAPTLVATTTAANTANQVLEMGRQAGLALGDSIAAEARETALATLAGRTAVEVLIFDRKGEVVGRAGFD
ncbi:MAG: cobalt-precorrin-5B (C(1))-methyltransferase [Alphaproteobacteria bacterium]|jgi:cobalt-precorrin-5B (C1)-methyltransferase|nr:cobalt-precorrin-5B (C(1))-methyltransferase [Alphaproteobacteria bacterium]